MSHIEDVDVLIEDKDLETLAEVLATFGATLKRGQTHYAWFGTSVGDYPLPKGFTAADLGHCDHAIKLPSAKYEIGVVRRKDGNGYTLLYDFWGQTQGLPLKTTFGDKLSKLTTAYGVAKAHREVARLKAQGKLKGAVTTHQMSDRIRICIG